MKVIAPLMSKTASGSIGNVLTFSKKKSGQMCRFQRKQKSSESVNQAPQRAAFLNAISICNNMDFGVLFFGISFFGNQLSLYTAEAEKRHITEQNQCASEILNN
ncbi:MAG: hypothetical protein WC310_05465 [Patescibacteria group bacterium]|jgi:hypothetical protein